MNVRRRVLLCAQIIGVCSLGTAPVWAQADVVGLNGRRAVAEQRGQGPGLAHSLRRSADRRIDLELNQVALKDALRAIARQGGVGLLYNDSDIPVERAMTVTITDATVSEALTILLRGTGLRARPTKAGIMIERWEKGTVSESRERQASISGTVTDAQTHEPIASVTVRLEATALAAITSRDGRYRIPDVQTGTYTLSARQVGYQKITKAVTVADGEEVTVDLAMTRSPTILDQVVTTGTVIPTEVKALPSPISVITAEQIAQQQHSTLASIIRHAVPTAVAFANPDVPSSTRVSVRGASSLSGAGNMKIFMDGVEATSSTFASVDPASIARIEILRGPQAATIYGADAAGGVVQIFTNRGDTTVSRPQLDARIALGIAQTPYADFEDARRQRYTATVSGGGHDVSYHFGGGFTRLGDYVPDNGVIGQSTRGINGGVQFSRGILTADLSGRYHDDRAPVALNPLLMKTGFMPVSRPYYTDLGIVNETYGARMIVTPVGWWRNQFTVGIDRMTEHSVQTQPRLTTPSDTLLSFYDYFSRKLSMGYNTTVTGALSRTLNGSITVGLDHYTQNVNSLFTSQALDTSGTIQTSPSGALNYSTNTVTNTGYFAQIQVSVRDALFLTGGVRAEDNSAFGLSYGTIALPRVGISLVRQFGTTAAKVRGSYGKALRAPGAGQASGLVTSTSIQSANPELAPERQQGWDTGFDLAFGNRASLAVTGYDQTAEDLIAFLQVATTPIPTYQYQNVGRVSNRGVEVEGTVGIMPELELRAQYGYVRSRIEKINTTTTAGVVQAGDQPLGVPTHTAGASLTATPARGTTLTAGVTYVGSFRQTDVLAEYRCLASFTAEACPESFLATFSTRAFNATYPGFAKVNVTAAHRFTEKLEAFLSIDNLANNDAYEGTNTAPVVGRSTMAGIHLTF